MSMKVGSLVPFLPSIGNLVLTHVSFLDDMHYYSFRDILSCVVSISDHLDIADSITVLHVTGSGKWESH